MLPGNSSQEFDLISLTPSTVLLKTDRLNASGNDIGDVSAGWNFKTKTAIGIAGTNGGNFGAIGDGVNNNNVLQLDFPGINNNLAITSFNWGAALPVSSVTNKGDRPAGDPEIHDLVFSIEGRPNARLLREALAGISLGTTTDKPTLRLPLNQQKSNPSYGIEFPSAVVTGYLYED